MFQALTHAVSAISVLVLIAGFGFVTSQKGWYDEAGRSLIARLVNLSIPCFLFYSITSKFTHAEFMALLEVALLPFITVGLNFLISVAIVRMGWIRREIQGAFVACFTSSTVLFVGVPLTLAMFGEKGIPSLLVYFFANCLFIWTVGLYNIELDGVRKKGGQLPRVLSGKSLKMFLSPPLLSFVVALVCVVASVPVPQTLTTVTHYLGQLTTPLALIFVGITVQKTGFGVLRRLPRELWLILFSCFVLRPLLMYLCSLPFDMDPMMRRVFIVASALPVSSVMAVLSKAYEADDVFASSAIGVSTVGLIVALPVILVAVSLIH